jgi:hypothetical protein
MSFAKRLPTPLGQRIASATSSLYARQGREFDVAIGGVPFMLATSNDLTESVETIQVRKDQVDTEDPGEQSLTGYWRRSQATFHEGAGNLYQETTLNPNSFRPIPGNGFYTSSGVDVFTPGRATLIKKMKAATVTGSQYTRIRSFAINSVRTNLCTNPNFELDTAGWSGASGGEAVPTLARSTARFHSGTASLLVTFNADDATGIPPYPVFAFATAIGQTYTISANVYVPSGTVGIGMLVGGVAFGNNTGSLKDQWVRLTQTFVATGVSSQVQFWPVTPTAAGQTFNIDDVLFENSTIVGDYFDGSSANSAWSGTANASASTQTITSSSTSFSAVGDGALHTSTLASGSFASLHAPVGKTVVDGLIANAFFYDVASDGTLYEGSTASPGTATTWPLGAAASRLTWGKYRLWVIGGRNIWQPDLSLVGGTSQSPIFTNPNKGWTYTCSAEGPGAMYFGGHDGFTSSIQAITLDGSLTSSPYLTAATESAVLPTGELVQELAVLAGQFIGIGTNRGFRMGVINADGSITYGPLIIEPSGVQACTSMTAQSRFIVVGFRATGGNALAYRIDTSVEVNPSESNGIFAYASDIDLGFVGTITSLVPASTTQLVCTASDGKVYYQSTTDYVDYGYMQSGRIRFRTTEPKTFRFVGVGIEPLAGAVAVSLVKSDLSTLPIGSITTQGQTFTDQFFYGGDPMEFASVKLELTPTANKLSAPVITSTLLRALPAVRPQRLITLALLCYNSEQSRSGQRYGGQTFAADRLNAMLSLEDGAQVLTFQDLSGALGNHQVTIESMKFASTVPPTGAGGTGGVIVIQLRTVDS